MREKGGRPTPGMSAGVYSVGGEEEKARMNFLLVKEDSDELITSFKHIVRKSQDPTDWMKNGLKILSEWHYQHDSGFSPQLTALFNMESPLAEALETAGQCHLKFVQDSISFAFDFEAVELDEADEAFQATYWHNHLFNATLPGKVRVFGFNPKI